MGPNEPDGHLMKSRTLPIAGVVAVTAAAGTLVATLAFASSGTARRYSASDVRAAFAAAHVRLEGRPAVAAPLAATFYAPQLKAYVLVRPRSSKAHPTVRVTGLPVVRVRAANVEIDLPPADRQAQKLAKRVLTLLP